MERVLGLTERYIEVGGKCGQYFTRNMVYPYEKRQDAFKAIYQKTGGTDMYYCTYLFDNPDRTDGTKYISPLYFDIDGDIKTDESFEKLRFAVLSLITVLCMDLRMEAKEFKIYFSGSKGFHVFVGARVLGIQPYEKLNLIYKAFVQHVASKVEHGELIDTKIYDCKRLIRVPNSINGKTGFYKIPVTYEELRTLTRHDLLDKARLPRKDWVASNELNQHAAARFREYIAKFCRAPRKHKKRQIPTDKKKLPPCMRPLLSEQVARGGRNSYLAMLASILIQNGYAGDPAMEVLHAWNDNNDEPLGDEEVRATYESMERLAREGRGYGCSSIREKNVFPPRQVCPKCKIFQKMRR